MSPNKFQIVIKPNYGINRYNQVEINSAKEFIQVEF